MKEELIMSKRKRSWQLNEEWDGETTKKGLESSSTDEKPSDAEADEKILADTEPRPGVEK